jgi:hypothetical protein
MPTRSLRRCTLLAAVLLAAPALQGAEAPRPQPAAMRAAATAPAAPAAGVWAWFVAIWDAVGCSIDPNGHCAPDAGPPATTEVPAGEDLGEVGCSLDPDGCAK